MAEWLLFVMHPSLKKHIHNQGRQGVKTLLYLNIELSIQKNTSLYKPFNNGGNILRLKGPRDGITGGDALVGLCHQLSSDLGCGTPHLE